MASHDQSHAASVCGAPSESRGDFEGWRCTLPSGHEGNHVIGRPSDDELAAQRTALASVVISTGHRLDFKVTDAEAAKVIKYVTKLVKDA